jgi:hypothetical protein
MPGHGCDFFRRRAVLGEPAQRRFPKPMRNAPRWQAREPHGPLNKFGKVPKRLAARIGDYVLHSDDGTGRERAGERPDG